MIAGIGDVEIDLDAFEIRHDGRPVRVEPQVFEVLRVLIENHGRLVTKEELLDTVWGTRFVSESSLTSRVKIARRILGDDGRAQRIIQTVHGRGYRLVAPVHTSGRRGRSVVEAADGALEQGATGLLERDAALRAIETAAAESARGLGRVVLVAGEPGIGKTALVRAFLERLDANVRILAGACDDLVTPRALGPFDDIAIDLPALGDALANPSPGAVQRVLLAELSAGRGPTVLVIEDVHWADEATLDVLTSVVRRIERTPVTVLLTYRDSEVVGAHPLLRVLGSVSPTIARYSKLRPLSLDAIAELVGDDDAESVAAATGGVPFFVSELAALPPSERTSLPASVAHAVLARIITMPDDTRLLLDRLAVEPTRTSTAVLDELQPGWVDVLGPAERAAVVMIGSDWLGFRHELARLAVLDAMSPSHRRAMHRSVAEALVRTGADPDRIVHHATATGDADLLLVHAIPAARRAAAATAHRQAWAHLQRVLPFIDRLPAGEVAPVLELASREAYDAGDSSAAYDLAERSLAEYDAAGDVRSAGRLHRWLSRVHWIGGRGDEAWREAELAVELLEPLGASEELAWAYSVLSQLAMLSSRHAESEAFGERAIALAREIGARSVLAHSMVNLATIRQRSGDDHEPEAREAVAVAIEAGEHHEAVRGLLNYAYQEIENGRLERGAVVAKEALAMAEEHEIETLRHYLVTMLARIEMLRGHWSVVEGQLAAPLRTSINVIRLTALRTLAQLQVRRGDSGASETIAEHRRLVDPTGEAERHIAALQVEAEDAWLHGDLERLVPELTDAIAIASVTPVHIGVVARWIDRAGHHVDSTLRVPEPYRAELDRRWQDAADAWAERGMPYEEALALLELGGDGISRAREIAVRLGARPLIDLIDRRRASAV